MNFTLSDEHLALRDSAAAFLGKEWSLEAYLRPEANRNPVPYGPIWSGIRDLGWPGMAIPEADGGLGMSCLDLVMVVGEMGRALTAAPLFGTLAGAWAIERTGSSAQRAALLPKVAAGELTLALAVADPDGDVDGLSGGATASQSAGTWTINGAKSFVVDANAADKLVVVAMDEGRQAFFLVDAKADGLAIERLDWRDPTREVCAVRFDSVTAERLEHGNADSWSWIRDRLYLVLAAESAAGIERVLADTVAYAKERVAFGQPIGAFQAIKHSLAEAAGMSECATAGVQYAAWALGEGTDDASKVAAMAQSYASDAYREATHRGIQIFGAIGFTWEMPNHLYYKRARANAELLGAPRAQREQVVRMLEAEHAWAA